MSEATELLDNDPRIRELFVQLHARQWEDPIYREGFLSAANENPYEFPLETNLQQTRIGGKEGALTEEERAELARLNAELNASAWWLWGQGHHAATKPYLKPPTEPCPPSP